MTLPSVHMGQALFVIVYSTVNNMECWVLLLQEVQPSPKVFYLLLSGHARHEVMTATHNEAGEDFCGIAVIGGIYIKTPCDMLLLLVVLDVGSECFELIRSAVMFENNIPVRLPCCLSMKKKTGANPLMSASTKRARTTLGAFKTASMTI